MKVLNQSNISLITRRDLWTCYTGGNDLDIVIIATHHLCLNQKPSSLFSLALASAMTDLWLILVIKCSGTCKFEDHVGARDWGAKKSESFILLVRPLTPWDKVTSTDSFEGGGSFQHIALRLVESWLGWVTLSALTQLSRLFVVNFVVVEMWVNI